VVSTHYCKLSHISRFTGIVRNRTRTENALEAGTYVEPQAPYWVRMRTEASEYMREWRRRKKAGLTAPSKARSAASKAIWEQRKGAKSD
jgi:hypothetical protein